MPGSTKRKVAPVIVHSAGTPGDQPAPTRAMRRAVTLYVVYSVIALITVSLAVVLLSAVVARMEALRDAKHTARAIADAIVAPLANEDFHAGEPAALAALGEAMDYRSRDGSITHTKVWADAGNGYGRVIWANSEALVGQSFAMEEEEYALFGTEDVIATVSDLEKEENLLERSAGQLVEVYAGTWDANGDPLLFEAYISTAGLSDETQALTKEILPLPLGALMVLSLATLPLAVSLARRVDRGQQQMRGLLVNAVEASDLERRRISQDLHDGVIQDLAGVCYALASTSRHLPEGSGSREQIDQATDILRQDLTALRTLMTDIYPPQLDERGLGNAVRDLGDQLGPTRAAIHFELSDSLEAPPIATRLAYRAVRELLGNAIRHAHATMIVVRLHPEPDALRFSVVDDGVGFDPGLPSPEGHLGLRLVEEMITEAGGSLVIKSAAGSGTRALGRLPF